VPIVVLNDGWLGLMKVKQERLANPLSASELGAQVDPPAHYFGVPVRGARTPEELADAVRWGLSVDGPSVIEAFVDVEQYSKTVFD
jgi:thiamine pyrophosphate-dependent acetolactate synthase large subunit-like protein